MKKICTILTIVCALILGSTVVYAQELTGTWKLTKMIAIDENGNKGTVPAGAIGMVEFVFGANNIVYLNKDGQVVSGIYQLKTNILSVSRDGNSIDFPINFIDAYTMEIDMIGFVGESVVFIMEKEGVPVKSASARTSARKPYTGPTNLVGTWKAAEATVLVNGFEVTLELGGDFDMELTFTADKKVTGTMDGETGQGTYHFDGKELTIIVDGEPESINIEFVAPNKFSVYEPESGAIIFLVRE